MAPHKGRDPGKTRVERGFTLVEVMLAVALLSIIVTVMYSAFHTMGRIVRRNEQTKGAYQVARLIMSRISEDLTCAYFSPTRKYFVFRGEDVQGTDGDADALTFVTAGHVVSGKDAAEGDFAEVSYYLDENNPGILVRREDVSPDGKPDVGGILDILGKNVTGLNFTFFDATQQPAQRRGETSTEEDETEREKRAWKPEWESDETPYLPRAVRVDLSVLNDAGQVEDFSTTVVLAMGRTPTSNDPSPPLLRAAAASPGPQPQGPPRRGGRQPVPLEGGPAQVGPRPERRGERGDFEQDSGRRRGGRGREGTPREIGTGSRVGTPSTPTIPRRMPNAGPGIRPPTPTGR